MKFCELGRSMVEMLGVLAIIGVLSVGAISGYSKAMFKYKLNKELTGYSWLINHLNASKTLYTKVAEYTYLVPYLNKTNSIPEGFTIYEQSWLYDVFGLKSRIYTRGQNIIFEVTLAQQGQTGKENSSLCYNFFSDLLIPSAESLYQVSMYLPNENSPATKYGSSYCKPSSGNCLHSMDLDAIYNYCQSCVTRSNSNNSCVLVLTI